MILAPEKQCEVNIRAWWAAQRLPGYKLPEPIRTAPDRCFYPRTDDLEKGIRLMAAVGVLGLANFRNHGPTAVAGFREAVGRGGAQIVVHREDVEIDFDYWNPCDVVGLIGHGWEVLTNRIKRKKTDPYRVARMLRERGIHA